MLPTLAIFGITGRTGQALLSAADAGWRVRGFVRTPIEIPGVEVVVGTFTDDERVRLAVSDAAAVCCVFGQRWPSTDVFCASATEAIVGAMHAVGCDRLICQTGAMIGPDEGVRRSRPMQWAVRRFAQRQPAVAHDRANQENVVIASNLRWTIVKPPRLTDGRPRGRVQAGPDVRVGMLSSIRRADLAAFLLREARDGTFLRSRVVVKG